MLGDDVDQWAEGPIIVRLGADAIELPYGIALRRRAQVPLTAIRKHALSKSRKTLLVATIDRTYWLDEGVVGGAEALASIADALTRRIALHPQAQQIRATIAQLDDLEEVFHRRRPIASWVFIGLCIAIFAAQWLAFATLPGSAFWGDLGPPKRWARMLAFGANAPALVAQGDYFRLATANFLHAHVLHLAANLSGLVVLGPVLERIWGSWRLVAVFLLSGLTGAVASTWLTAPVLSVGVSTSLLGILAAYIVIWIRHRSALPPLFIVPKDRWPVLAIVTVVLWMIVPTVDHWGHFGGALGGAVFAWAMHRSKADFRIPVGRPTQLLAVVLAGLFVAAAGWTLGRALQRGPTDDLVAVVRAQGQRSSIAANQIAWAIVTASDVDSPLLEAAKDAAKAASTDEDVEIRAASLDTLATAYFRLGQFDAAVRWSWASVTLSPQSETMSQLTRFLQALLRDGEPATFGVELTSQPEISFSDAQVTLTGVSGLPAITVVGLVFHGNDLQGSLWLRGHAADAPLQWSVASETREALRHPKMRLMTGLIATDRVIDSGDGASLKYLTMDPEIRSLP